VLQELSFRIFPSFRFLAARTLIQRTFVTPFAPPPTERVQRSVFRFVRTLLSLFAHHHRANKGGGDLLKLPTLLGGGLESGLAAPPRKIAPPRRRLLDTGLTVVYGLSIGSGCVCNSSRHEGFDGLSSAGGSASISGVFIHQGEILYKYSRVSTSVQEIETAERSNLNF